MSDCKQVWRNETTNRRVPRMDLRLSLVTQVYPLHDREPVEPFPFACCWIFAARNKQQARHYCTVCTSKLSILIWEDSSAISAYWKLSEHGFCLHVSALLQWAHSTCISRQYKPFADGWLYVQKCRKQLSFSQGITVVVADLRLGDWFYFLFFPFEIQLFDRDIVSTYSHKFSAF